LFRAKLSKDLSKLRKLAGQPVSRPAIVEASLEAEQRQRDLGGGCIRQLSSAQGGCRFLSFRLGVLFVGWVIKSGRMLRPYDEYIWCVNKNGGRGCSSSAIFA